jgi:hypothetical protein
MNDVDEHFWQSQGSASDRKPIFSASVSEWAHWGECGPRGRRRAAFGITCPSHRRYQDGGEHGDSVSSAAVTAPTSTY